MSLDDVDEKHNFQEQEDARQFCFHLLLGMTLDLFQVHYPVEAIPSIPFSDSKGQLLEAQVSSVHFILI